MCVCDLVCVCVVPGVGVCDLVCVCVVPGVGVSVSE